jgi:Ni,Fe-hydrogenase III small subunit
MTERAEAMPDSKLAVATGACAMRLAPTRSTPCSRLA